MSFALEYRIVRADGEVRWVLDRGQLVPGSGGRLWIDGAMFDVTERRAAEEALREREVERARTEELRASRARIVEAADAARRRIERDLHDGAQQRLVLVSLTLKRAEARAKGTPAEEVLVEASDQLREGLAELRDLAHGIHPAVLGEHGLGAALDGLVARCPFPVDVRVAPERAAPAVEAAIYFTIAEALTNVAKYAQATQASVTIEVEDGTLVAEVTDDGVGGASMAGGSGLRGLEDRLDAIGGTLTVHSRAGQGHDDPRLRAAVPGVVGRPRDASRGDSRRSTASSREGSQAVRRGARGSATARCPNARDRYRQSRVSQSGALSRQCRAEDDRERSRPGIPPALGDAVERRCMRRSAAAARYAPAGFSMNHSTNSLQRPSVSKRRTKRFEKRRPSV